MTTAQTEAWTIKRLLEWTAAHFRKRGRDAPQLAAEILLSEALGCRRIDLYARYEEVPQEAALARFREWVKRHAAGEPVAYLVGYRDFYSLRFRVTPAVLVPRPETEHLVVAAIEWCERRRRTQPAPPHIIDVGTGSGCIAITLAKHLPQAVVTATDISAAALEVACENAIAHGMAERIRLVQSDLFAAFDPSERFDLIISNPPYIGRAEVGTVDPHVHAHEPHDALYSGADGSELTARIIAAAPERLRPDGRLLIETSPLIAGRCLDLLSQQAGLTRPRLLKDLSRHDRVLVADAA